MAGLWQKYSTVPSCWRRAPLLLLLVATLVHESHAAQEEEANFGASTLAILLYRSASGSQSVHCISVSERFRQPPESKESDVFRGVEFRHAHQSCQLGLDKVASAKHVFLILPDDKAHPPCPFETALAHAVSARAYSLIVARGKDLQSQKLYLTPGTNGTVPPQDIIVGLITVINAAELAEAAAGNGSLGGDVALLYRLNRNLVPTWAVLCLVASTTVALGALWAGSTRKMLFLTQHQRIKPEDHHQTINDDDDSTLGGVPVFDVPLTASELEEALWDDVEAQQPQPESSSGLNAWPVFPAPSTEPREDAASQTDVVELQAQPEWAAWPPSEYEWTFPEDFTNSLGERAEKHASFIGCPVDCKLLVTAYLLLSANLLVLYYFFNQLYVFQVGCITISAMMSLIAIFDYLAFLIPCASRRLPNVAFPCFVRSMELRHHVVIWLAVAIPILWLSFRKHPHAWILQNFLGLCFAINILRCVHFPSFKTISLVLFLLFCYDIFMVFVTSYLSKGVSVMESVASGFYDLPVLMRVPHLRPGNAAACRDIVVILGCGDIVVPGLAVAYCRSYDVMVKKGSRYFLLAIVCYVVTLVVTLLITSHLNTGQPALLYLVPGVLLPVLILAWWRGDLKKFWQGDLVPPESDMAPRVDAHVSSNEQFQMMQSRGLLYVATPVVSWFVIPLPVSQKDYDAKGN